MNLILLVSQEIYNRIWMAYDTAGVPCGMNERLARAGFVNLNPATGICFVPWAAEGRKGDCEPHIVMSDPVAHLMGLWAAKNAGFVADREKVDAEVARRREQENPDAPA